MADLISRNEAREIIADMRGLCRNDVLCDAMAKINALPSMSAVQEPVEPIRKPEIFDLLYFCGKCSARVGIQKRKDESWRVKYNYCPDCGRKVKWE